MTGAIVVSLVVGLLVSAGRPAAGLGYSPVVDSPSAYEPQRTCTGSPAPGTVALARWLLRTYPQTRSMGMMRACGTGGHSEHKDGRAFDWGADVGRRATRRAAYGFIRQALATDSAGNTHALARRLGIMYVIYDDTIWASYRDFAPRPYLNAACKSLRKCSRTLRHLNHVHISLGLAGAAAQTSWYRSRNVASRPVLHPGTADLDADLTAVTGLSVPTTGTVVRSSFVLRAGVTYRIVATGTVRPGVPGSGDANCVAGDDGWARTPRGTVVPPVTDPGGNDWGGWGGWSDQEGSDHADSPYAAPTSETQGLLVNGALRWEGDCQADHTYEAWFTPAARQRLSLAYADSSAADNGGTFSVYVARDDITRASLAR